MKTINDIRKVQKIVITRKKEKLLTFENVYIKFKPDAIDISDYEDFRLLMYFPLDEVNKFVIKEYDDKILKSFIYDGSFPKNRGRGSNEQTPKGVVKKAWLYRYSD